MLHLIHNSYLERIDFFPKLTPSQSDQTFIYNEGQKLVVYDGEYLEDFLDQNFQGSFYRLFEYLSSSEEPLILYVRERDFVEVAIIYWLSILKDNSAENLFFIYEHYLKNLRLTSSSCSHSLRDLNVINSFEPLNIKEFNEIYNYCTKEAVDLTKFVQHFSLEYLMADYFSTRQFTDFFLKKIEALYFDKTINDIFKLRNCLIQLLYRDINQVLPTGFSIDYEGNIEAQIKRNPYLNWIFDIEVSFQNSSYIRKNLDIEILDELRGNIMSSSFGEHFFGPEETSFNKRIWDSKELVSDYWSSLFERSIEKGTFGVDIVTARRPQMNLLLVTSLFEENTNKKLNKLTSSLSLK